MIQRRYEGHKIWKDGLTLVLCGRGNMEINTVGVRFDTIFSIRYLLGLLEHISCG